jgi:hypothetical protein
MIRAQTKPFVLRGRTDDGTPIEYKLLGNTKCNWKKATYLGSGLSGDVWDLNNGTVVKITSENDALTFYEYLLNNPTPGLANVCAVVHQAAIKTSDHHASIKRYTAVVMEKYETMNDSIWEKIVEKTQHLDFSDKPNRWGRGSLGEPARLKEGADIAYNIAVTSRKIKKIEPSHPLAHCSLAFTVLYQWLEHKKVSPYTGLDIDKADNWGLDSLGRPVLYDPWYTCKRKQRLMALDARETDFNIEL